MVWECEDGGQGGGARCGGEWECGVDGGGLGGLLTGA